MNSDRLPIEAAYRPATTRPAKLGQPFTHWSVRELATPTCGWTTAAGSESEGIRWSGRPLRAAA